MGRLRTPTCMVVNQLPDVPDPGICKHSFCLHPRLAPSPFRGCHVGSRFWTPNIAWAQVPSSLTFGGLNRVDVRNPGFKSTLVRNGGLAWEVESPLGRGAPHVFAFGGLLWVSLNFTPPQSLLPKPQNSAHVFTGVASAPHHPLDVLRLSAPRLCTEAASSRGPAGPIWRTTARSSRDIPCAQPSKQAMTMISGWSLSRKGRIVYPCKLVILPSFDCNRGPLPKALGW